MVLEAIFPELNAGWFPFLIAELSDGRHGSINFKEKVNFFKMFGMPLLLSRFFVSRQHVNVGSSPPGVGYYNGKVEESKRGI
jgi:hypothetical protein